MKKKYMILISSIILFGALFGCSTKKENFNDKNIIFNIVNSESTNEFNSYTIEISNKTGLDLTHLSFNLSYPIKTSNGSKGNPFVVEGKTDNGIRPVNLKTGKTINYSILAPIIEVFSDTDLLDIKNPRVDLKGYVREGKKDIPFEISGGLRSLVNNY